MSSKKKAPSTPAQSKAAAAPTPKKTNQSASKPAAASQKKNAAPFSVPSADKIVLDFSALENESDSEFDEALTDDEEDGLLLEAIKKHAGDDAVTRVVEEKSKGKKREREVKPKASPLEFSEEEISEEEDNEQTEGQEALAEQVRSSAAALKKQKTEKEDKTATKQTLKKDAPIVVVPPTATASSSSSSSSSSSTSTTTPATTSTTTTTTTKSHNPATSFLANPGSEYDREALLARASVSSKSILNNITQATDKNAVQGRPLNVERKVIIVLVKAALETIKTKKGEYELITADTHKATLMKYKKNPSEFRPDILHQCLLTLLDSPLNKAGHLQVYIQTEKNVCIEVNPAIRIPRTFKRFAGLMVQLLHKLKIRSSDSSDMLLKVVKSPITSHLPPHALKIGTSVQGELVDIRELAKTVVGPNPTAPVVFCFGSHAVGPADVDWTDQSIAISKYPLSASVALGRVMNAFEGLWDIL